MPLFTSDGDDFEITALSFSPKIFTEGDSVNFSVTLTNKTGVKITSLAVCFYLFFPAKVYQQLNDDGEWGVADGFSYTSYEILGSSGEEIATSWANNASKTFTGVLQISYSPIYYNEGECTNITTRVLPITTDGEGLRMTIEANQANIYSYFSNLYGANHEYATPIDRHYSPTVQTFDAERVSNDEDPNIKTSVKLSVADGLTDTQKARMSWHVYSSGTAISFDSSITLAQLITGITDSTTFITSQFDKDYDHQLSLTFGDEYELAKSTTVTIPRGFANMHLSGKSTGGVCFGGFCKSAENNPMFECYYPAYFYGGIEGIKSVQCGTTELIAVNKASYSDKTVTFSTPFTERPTVMLTLLTGSVAYAMGNFLPTLLSVTTTGFTMRLFNNTGANRSFYVEWLAYGQM